MSGSALDSTAFMVQANGDGEFIGEPPPAYGGPSRPSFDRSASAPNPPPLSHRRGDSRNANPVGHASRPSRENNPQPLVSSATSEVVVPNKSRLREEEIEVPYARESRHDEQSEISRESYDEGRDRSRTANDQSEVMSPVLTDDRDYFDRMSFGSNLTSKSKPHPGEDRESKIRAEYEFKIAGLERRANAAESERDEAKRILAMEKDRRKEWEDEVRGLKEVGYSSVV